MGSDPQHLLCRGSLASWLLEKSVRGLFAQIREGGEPMMAIDEMKSATVTHCQLV